ncbi:MAG: PilT/PilU family type 4a pilus ATPase [Patescibacteria group bacterium]|jgi:twitching motility protein PilT
MSNSQYDLLALTKAVAERGASDLHLVPGVPPRMRLNGDLEDLAQRPMQLQEIEAMAALVLMPEQINAVHGPEGVADAARFLEGRRWRINVCKHRQPSDENQAQGIAMAFRYLPNKIWSFAELGLPAAFMTDVLQYRKGGGIVLVTGSTGSGKTTSLAAMVDFINVNEPAHIITIEAPVEIIHHSKKSIVTQREMPNDTPSFKDAIRDSLREDPDVILVGEMRDLETIAAALEAAETGHLVLATLHTNSAADTIDRIINVFPANQQQQVRTQLAMTLRAVICQGLVPRADGQGRIAAFELMTATYPIRNHIRRDEAFRIASVIQTQGKAAGMILFDDYLRLLVKQGAITAKTAAIFARSPQDQDL